MMETNTRVQEIFAQLAEYSPREEDRDTAVIAVEEMGLSKICIESILLQQCIKQGSHTLEDIEKTFGSEVSQIIKGLLKVSQLYAKNPAIETENFRELLLSFAEDMRVIFIIIAEKVNLMRRIKDEGTEEDRVRISREARYLYAPLAHS